MQHLYNAYIVLIYICFEVIIFICEKSLAHNIKLLIIILRKQLLLQVTIFSKNNLQLCRIK